MAVEVAVDNSVVFDLVNPDLPKNKEKDRLAFQRIVEFARKNDIEIGQPVTGTFWKHRTRQSGSATRYRKG